MSSAYDENCPNGIGIDKRIFVFTFGKSDLTTSEISWICEIQNLQLMVASFNEIQNALPYEYCNVHLLPALGQISTAN